MIWLLDEGMLALQAGAYRRLSAGGILEMGCAARVGASVGGPHTVKEQLLNVSQVVLAQHRILRIFRSQLVLGAGRSSVWLRKAAVRFQRARGHVCHPSLVCREV